MLPIVIPLRAEEDRDWKVQPTPLQPLTVYLHRLLSVAGANHT